MSTVKIFTDNGMPCKQVDDGAIITIFSVQHLYATPTRILFRYNSGDGDILSADTLEISGAPVVGTNEEKAQALRNYFKDFFVEAPNNGGGGTDSFDSQSYTAASNQTEFTTTFDLPSDSKRVKVMVETNGVIVGLPFTKSGNKVTVSSRASGEKITVEKI